MSTVSFKQTENKISVAIIGATGAVGQKLVTLLANHPWFKIEYLAASENSANKKYKDAVEGKWMQSETIPNDIAEQTVLSIEKDMDTIAKGAKIVFSAFNSPSDYIREIEEKYAALGVAVISNNPAHRWTEDIPMMIPEINIDHLKMIDIQRANRGWDNGLIVTKPNCSIQSYVPLLKAWSKFVPTRVIVSTYQAISGAGKTFDTWTEMIDNIIPNIEGEGEKSAKEPIKILGAITEGKFKYMDSLNISATCIRVPVTDGHMASTFIEFEKDPSKSDLIDAIKELENPLDGLGLPSAPSPFITYFEQEDRPQVKIDRNLHNGMGVSVGRIRKDSVLGWKSVSLVHNTIRGAAGGGVLTAELLVEKGYINL